MASLGELEPGGGAAKGVRDLGPVCVRDHIRFIGEAIATVLEIREAICRTDLDLCPASVENRPGSVGLSCSPPTWSHP